MFAGCRDLNTSAALRRSPDPICCAAMQTRPAWGAVLGLLKAASGAAISCILVEKDFTILQHTPPLPAPRELKFSLRRKAGILKTARHFQRSMRVVVSEQGWVILEGTGQKGSEVCECEVSRVQQPHPQTLTQSLLFPVLLSKRTTEKRC